MGDAAAHVNFEQSAIERKRLIEFGKALIDFASEASAPKFRVRALAHSFFRFRVVGQFQSEHTSLVEMKGTIHEVTPTARRRLVFCDASCDFVDRTLPSNIKNF